MFNFNSIKAVISAKKVEMKLNLCNAEVKGWGAIGDGARAVAAYADKRKAEAEERREAFCAEVDKIFGITDGPEEVVEQPKEVKTPRQQAEEILKKGLQDNPRKDECWWAFCQAFDVNDTVACRVIIDNQNIGDNGIDGVYLEDSVLGITFYECGAPCEREYSLKTGKCVRDYNAERDWDCDWED